MFHADVQSKDRVRMAPGCTHRQEGKPGPVGKCLLARLRRLHVILRAPGSHLQAVSRRMAAMERAWGQLEKPQEAGISRRPETSVALSAPGTQWAGSSRWSCRGYRSQPPPRRHSWRGQAPQTFPTGRRWQSEPTQPRRPGRRTCVGTLGLGSVPSSALGQPWSLHPPR